MGILEWGEVWEKKYTLFYLITMRCVVHRLFFCAKCCVIVLVVFYLTSKRSEMR